MNISTDSFVRVLNVWFLVLYGWINPVWALIYIEEHNIMTLSSPCCWECWGQAGNLLSRHDPPAWATYSA